MDLLVYGTCTIIGAYAIYALLSTWGIRKRK